MTIKRLSAILLAAALLLSVLSGCAVGGDNTFDFGGESDYTFPTKAGETTTASGGETTDPTAPTDKTQGGTTTTPTTQTSVEVPSDMTVAEVKTVNGTPRLFIDGKEVPATLASINMNSTEEGIQTALRTIDKASKAGVHLFNIAIDVAGVRYVSMYVDKLYKLMKRVYDVDPEAKVILRFTVNNTPNYVNVSDAALAQINGGSIGCNYCSLASDIWLAGAVKMASNLAKVVMGDDFIRKMVVGYQPAAGDAGEWFGPEYWNGGMDTSSENLKAYRNWLKKTYKSNQALQEAWGNSEVTLATAQLPDYMDLPGMLGSYSTTGEYLMVSKENQHFVDYLTYTNERRAEVLDAIGAAIKQETGGKSLVVTLYSYHTEVYNPSSNSFGARFLLKSKNVDVLAGPVSYNDRNENGIGASMAFMSAVAAAGKIWIDEGDYRTTFRTADGINPSGGGQDGVGDSIPFIKTDAGVYEVLKRQQGKQMVFSTGTWYFDLVERGWYDNQQFWNIAGELNQLQLNYGKFRKGYKFDVAIVMDEGAMALSGDGTQNQRLLAETREVIYRSGLSFGYFLIDDVLEGRVDAKLYVMLNPWDISSDEATKLKKVLHQKGKTTLWMVGAGDTDAAVFKDLTGMTFKIQQDKKYSNTIETTTGSSLSGVGACPLYTVEEAAGVTVLGRYSSLSGKPVGYAMTAKDGWNSIFLGNTALTLEVLHHAAKLAGANFFVNNTSSMSGDVVYANDSMAVLYATTAGSRTVTFPKGCEAVYEYFTGKWYTGNSVTLNVQSATAYYFFYGKKADIQKAGIGK